VSRAAPIRPKPWLNLARVAVLLAFFAPPALAQNCALCYTQAASAGARMIEALRSGILILILPPTLGSIAMIFVVHRKRHQVRRPEVGDESRQDW
jgi:hypothetical protein